MIEVLVKRPKQDWTIEFVNNTYDFKKIIGEFPDWIFLYDNVTFWFKTNSKLQPENINLISYSGDDIVYDTVVVAEIVDTKNGIELTSFSNKDEVLDYLHKFYKSV